MFYQSFSWYHRCIEAFVDSVARPSVNAHCHIIKKKIISLQGFRKVYALRVVLAL